MPYPAYTNKEVKAISKRAVHNTFHNIKHGNKVQCDGFCATDECVCDTPIEEEFKHIGEG